MPASEIKMRLRAKQLEKSISQSPAERERNRKAKKEEEEGSTVGPWVLGLLLFVTVGSAFLQIFQHIQTSPSMSDSF
jgi:hypothetical protein